ncbi:MAG: condensation domain-containing protein, partial [Cyclobacteriaceae bacterium]
HSTFGLSVLPVEMEAHGREDIAEDLDINRTVGCFTSLFPVVLSRKEEQDPGLHIKRVKETLRRIPAKGIGYGILHYLSRAEVRDELKFDLRPEVRFNYFGQFDDEVRNEQFTILDASVGNLEDPKEKREYALDVIGMVTGGKLETSIYYSAGQYRAETIGRLAAAYTQALQELVTHCAGRDDTELTPSDFDYKDLSLEELDSLLD